MELRLLFYTAFFAAVYFGLSMLEQREEINLLGEYIIDQKQDIDKCRDLIKAQREYIDFLEAHGKTPLLPPVSPLYNRPI